MFIADVNNNAFSLSIEQKREVIEAFVIKICSNWEMFVDKLLIDCLNKDTSNYSNYTGFKLSKHLSKDICRGLVLGIGYTDFKSVGNLKRQAKRTLTDKYNPFKEIPSNKEKIVDEFYSIRNYLTHYSEFSKRSLMNNYKKNYGFRIFREPGDFLIQKDKETKLPRITNYINCFNEMVEIMRVFLSLR